MGGGGVCLKKKKIYPEMSKTKVLKQKCNFRPGQLSRDVAAAARARGLQTHKTKTKWSLYAPGALLVTFNSKESYFLFPFKAKRS